MQPRSPCCSRRAAQRPSCSRARSLPLTPCYTTWCVRGPLAASDMRMALLGHLRVHGMHAAAPSDRQSERASAARPRAQVEKLQAGTVLLLPPLLDGPPAAADLLSA
jgi:hypothetical protein